MIDLGTGNNNKMYVYPRIFTDLALISICAMLATGQWTINKR